MPIRAREDPSPSDAIGNPAVEVTVPDSGFLPAARFQRRVAMTTVCIAFVISRLIAYKLGIHFLSYDPGYWQYLERELLTNQS